MSVCKPSRPTSCRPCLMSATARLYRILSGSAVLSALVDLFNFFFFLWGIWASLELALNSNPAINVHVRVRRKRNPSPLSNKSSAANSRLRYDPFCSVRFLVYLNQRAGSARTCPPDRFLLISEGSTPRRVASALLLGACRTDALWRVPL